MKLYQWGITVILTLFALSSADVTLSADGNSGYDNVWTKRYEMGKNTWGIRGTGSSLSGYIWWDSFSGATGKYKVYLGAVTEPDGDSPYKFSINNAEVASGRYPYSTGSLNCGSSTLKVEDIYLGEHTVTNGVPIKYWAQSVYPCGSSHGQYSRFYQIRFVSVASQTDNTPPTTPSNLAQGTQTNTSVALSWSTASDLQSGVKHYRVYIGSTVAKDAVTTTSTTLTGLTRNTAYQDVRVSAVNNVNLEGPKSAAITLTTANESAPANTVFFKAVDGTFANAMAQKSADGAIAGLAAYGETGSTSGAADYLSRATYLVTLPTQGTWYLWARALYKTDAANSWWVSINGGAAKQFINGATLNAWHWEGQASGGGLDLGTLAAGLVTITISSREQGADNLLDAHCLTPSASYVPADADVDFTPLPIEKVNVLAPNGSEAFSTAQAMPIRWRADERHVADVNIELSLDNGDSWTKINLASSVTIGDPTWGNWPWQIPPQILAEGTLVPVASQQCLVRVSKYGSTDPDEADISDNPFTIGYTSVSGIPHHHSVPAAGLSVARRHTALELTLAGGQPATFTIMDLKGTTLRQGHTPTGHLVVRSLPHATVLVRATDAAGGKFRALVPLH